MASIGRNSRLRFHKLLASDGYEYWDMPQYPSLEPRSDDATYQVTALDRIDQLAHRFYGDPALWWVLAVANDIDLLPTGLVPGMYLRVPAPSFVAGQLFSGTTTL